MRHSLRGAGKYNAGISVMEDLCYLASSLCSSTQLLNPQELGIGLDSWFSKCDVWPCSLGIPRECVRNANSWAALQTYLTRNCGDGAWQSVFSEVRR